MNLTRHQALATGCLILEFLDDAERAGQHQRGQRVKRPQDEEQVFRNFKALEETLESIEADLGYRLR